MPWLVKLGDQSLSTGQIPIEKLEEIARTEGVRWHQIMDDNPAFVSWKRFQLVVQAVAETLGVPNPTDTIHNGDELMEAMLSEDEGKRWIVPLPDPTEIARGGDGLPTTPDNGTESSSPSSGDTDGPQTSSEDNVQTTS